MKKIILLIAFPLCFSTIIYAQAGELDSSFGSNGFITMKDNTGIARQVLLQSDGSSYVIISKDSQTQITKRLANGLPDLNYGNNSFSSPVDLLFSKAVFEKDSKIIVVGKSNNNFALARYNTDGTLDKSFSGDGEQTTDFGFGGSFATSVTMQTDGKIVLAGQAGNRDGTSVFALARYNTDGSLDNSFFNDGTKTTEVHDYNGGAYATTVAVQSNGKIVVGGYALYSSPGGSYSYIVLARYNNDGNRDLDFGDYNGFQITGYGFANSIAIQSDDKIVVAGQHTEISESDEGGYKTTSDFALARFNADGSVDHTFARGSTDFGYDIESASSVVIQDDGKIVEGGYVFNGNNHNFALARYNADGTLDNTFSDNGKQITELNEEDASIENIAIANNKLYAAGNGVVARYFLNNESKALTVNLAIPNNIVKYAAPARIKLNAEVPNASGTITKVRFYNDTTLLHTETEFPYGFLWIDVPVGNYSLTAKAFDDSGNVITSNAINVSVADENVPPVVSIVSPVDDTTYTGPATIHLIAKAKDPNDKISKVEFYNGTSLLRTEYYYPYTYTWMNVQPGTYTITAIATDDKGLSATSAPVTVTVTASNLPIVRNKPYSAGNKSGISLKLAPNPASHTLQIYTNGLQQNKSSTISVISAAGVVLKTIQSNIATKAMQLDVSSLVSGVYIIKVISGDKVTYKQFVKL